MKCVALESIIRFVSIEKMEKDMGATLNTESKINQ